METLEKFGDTLLSSLVDISFKILVSLIVFLVFSRLITLFSRRLEKKLLSGKHPTDKTLTTAIFYIGRIVLRLVLMCGLVGYLGVDTGGIAALLASVGVGVGLAVNGALSNLAGGVLLIITRPFKIDDLIEADGSLGVVEDIHITMTKLLTPDNKTVYIPNGKLSSEKIINYSERGTRRADMVFSADTSADGEMLKEIISDIINSHPCAMKDPAPFVKVSERGSEGIKITARVWCKSEDYLNVYFDISESVNLSLASENISAPHRKIDVNVNKN